MKHYSLLLLFVVSMVSQLSAETFKIGDLYYKMTTRGIYVTYGTAGAPSPSRTDYGGLTAVQIPGSVTYRGNNYPVKGVGDSAFAYCKDLKTIEIGSNVTLIWPHAFMATGLTALYLPSSVTWLGEASFSRCDNLSFVDFSPKMIFMDDSCFSFCPVLDTVRVHWPKPLLQTKNSPFTTYPSTLYVPTGYKAVYEEKVSPSGGADGLGGGHYIDNYWSNIPHIIELDEGAPTPVPTGITSASVTPATSAGYDLQGRPAKALLRGHIYLINKHPVRY